MLKIMNQSLSCLVVRDVRTATDWCVLGILTLTISAGLIIAHFASLRTVLLMDHSPNICQLRSEYLWRSPQEYSCPLDQITDCNVKEHYSGRTGSSFQTSLLTTMGERIAIPNIGCKGRL